MAIYGQLPRQGLFLQSRLKHCGYGRMESPSQSAWSWPPRLANTLLEVLKRGVAILIWNGTWLPGEPVATVLAAVKGVVEGRQDQAAFGAEQTNMLAEMFMKNRSNRIDQTGAGSVVIISGKLTCLTSGIRSHSRWRVVG